MLYKQNYTGFWDWLFSSWWGGFAWGWLLLVIIVPVATGWIHGSPPARYTAECPSSHYQIHISQSNPVQGKLLLECVKER